MNFSLMPPKLVLAATFALAFPLCALAAPEDSRAAYEAALRAAKDGDYAKALERHEWFHANGHIVDPSMVGVRSSYALSAWAKLGAKYPPALASLKKLRDDGTAKLTAGKGTKDDFSEVSVINRALSESATSIALFKQIEAKQPDLAKSCFNSALKKALFDAKEYAIYLRYSGDPKETLRKAIDFHSKGIAEAKSGGASMENRLGYELRTLARTTTELATAVAALGNPALAAELKAMTLKAQPDVKIEP